MTISEEAMKEHVRMMKEIHGRVDPVVMCDLQPMNTAPKDGSEILAYHLEGKNFHPIIWKDYQWRAENTPHWGMRWNGDYRTQDGSYKGWIEYPKLDT